MNQLETVKAPLAINLMDLAVSSLKGCDEANPSMSLKLMSGSSAAQFQRIVCNAMKKPIDPSTVLVVSKAAGDQSPGTVALLNGIQCDDNHHLTRGQKECYLLNHNQSCHYLLNLFHYLSHQKNAPLYFSVEDLNTLYAFLSHFVMQTVSLRTSRDMKIVVKIKVLLGLANTNYNIAEIMDIFAREGAERILLNVKLDPKSKEVKELVNYSKRWVNPGSAYSDQRYETRKITKERKRNNGRGKIVNEKVTYELPENVCQVSDHLQVLSDKGVFSYRDLMTCMGNIRRVPQEYKLRKHLRTYHIFDLTRDLQALESKAAALKNPISAELFRVQNAIYSVFGLALMKSTGLLSKDTTGIIINRVKEHLGIGEADVDNGEDRAALKK